MKRVIDGKVFNSATAEYVADVAFGAAGDFKHWSETLYKSPGGRFFLEYCGGPLSRYAVDRGPHLVYGSSGLRLLDNDEALGWCEEHDVDPDVVARFFDLEEG